MKPKILVGMSGGVDSAVAAHLLLQQGYDVIAGFMKNYADESNPHCHTLEDRETALKAAQYLGIKTFVIFDFREEYEETIIQYIYDGYQYGYTPNPDVLCNSIIKFDLFLKAATHLGCSHIATGHYARIMQDETGLYHLLKGIDTNKDQSYFLAGLSQNQLARSLFPIGHLTKPEVRTIAADIGLPNADRKESQGLCFIGKVPMKEFLEKHLPHTPGIIKDTSGTILGEHPGHYFYTIGQRQGLGLPGGPWYVIKKDPVTNELIVGHANDEELYDTDLTATKRHRIGQEYTLPFQAAAKIRYRQPDQQMTLIGQNDSIMQVSFEAPQRAITAGQTIAVYHGDDLIASGIIQ